MQIDIKEMKSLTNAPPIAIKYMIGRKNCFFVPVMDQIPNEMNPIITTVPIISQQRLQPPGYCRIEASSEAVITVNIIIDM